MQPHNPQNTQYFVQNKSIRRDNIIESNYPYRNASFFFIVSAVKYNIFELFTVYLRLYDKLICFLFRNSIRIDVMYYVYSNSNVAFRFQI